jgi:hypothetical protein
MRLLYRLRAIRLFGFGGVSRKSKNNSSTGKSEQVIQREKQRYQDKVIQTLEATRQAFAPDVWKDLRPLESGIRRDLERASSKETAWDYIRWQLSHFHSDDTRVNNIFVCLKGRLALIH